MKKISNLGKVLSRDEAKKIIGGDYGGNNCNWSCSCDGSVGEWSYTNSNNQPTADQRSQDIETYCSSGQGGCSREQC